MVHAFELPLIGDVVPRVPQLAIAAAGSEPDWRGAALLWSGDGGASWTSAGASEAGCARARGGAAGCRTERV
jgi:hypothetical protein